MFFSDYLKSNLLTNHRGKKMSDHRILRPTMLINSKAISVKTTKHMFGFLVFLPKRLLKLQIIVRNRKAMRWFTHGISLN